MIINNAKICVGCEACKNICKKNAITMVVDAEGFYYPKIDEMLCSNCGLCSSCCPLNKIDNREETFRQVYVCQHKDDKIRLKSSSGGAFSAIAEQVIKEGGIVYGAAYNSDWEVEHVGINTIEELPKLYGSKYVQSKINNTFREIKELLDNKQLVLFSGTPCQVEGLLSFLKKEYETLYTLDFVCHGVPSPKIFNKYIKEMQKRGDIKEVFFRDKRFGYSASTMVIEYANGKKDVSSSMMKSYKKMYFKGLISRPSCYDCNFKTIARRSDFTVFDCWSMDVFCLARDDDKGASYLFLQSEKSVNFFNKLKNLNCVLINDAQRVIDLDGQMMIKSDVMNPQRQNLFTEIEKLEYDKLVKKYAPDSLKEKCINKIKPFIYKLKIIQNIKRKKSRNKKHHK